MFRKPDYIVKLVEKISEDFPCRFTFFSKGSCEDWLRKEAEKFDCIKPIGFVPKKELDMETANSDFLVSIGNSLPEGHNAVPSKIFEYMSTGKPIIHILAGDNDICRKYFAAYPNIILIDPRVPFENNLTTLKQFLSAKRGVRVPFAVVAKTLVKNTPQYSVDLIEEVLNGKVKK